MVSLEGVVDASVDLDEAWQISNQDVDFDGSGDEENRQHNRTIGPVGVFVGFQPKPEETRGQNSEVEGCTPPGD